MKGFSDFLYLNPESDKEKVLGNKFEEIISPIPQYKLEQEISSLDEASIYYQSGDFSVFIVDQTSLIPNLIMEIGRLREISFRQIGEGTGKSYDVDTFDEYYKQVILWDNKNNCIAGGYRIGMADEILNSSPNKNLYCSSLFNFEEDFLAMLSSGIEVGRSFIAPNYQKLISPLLFLWKAVGKFFSEKKKYRYLFGPVSISNNYTAFSKNIIIDYVSSKHYNESLASKIKAKNPFLSGQKNYISNSLESIKEVSAEISTIEPDGKKFPILLKHYIKLNATILSFNVDENFCNSIDALILVDVNTIPDLLKKKYLFTI